MASIEELAAEAIASAAGLPEAREALAAYEAGDLDYSPISGIDAPWIRYDETLGPDLRERAVRDTLLGIAVSTMWGWDIGAAIVFGLCLSVASTVVLLRALEAKGLATMVSNPSLTRRSYNSAAEGNVRTRAKSELLTRRLLDVPRQLQAWS